MPQSSVILRNTEPWIPTNHSSGNVLFNHYSNGPHENGQDAKYENSLNDVESLKKGIIKTSVNKSYTILLVGETGVGKSSIIELIANVLVGNDINNYDFSILDHANERSNNQGQTNSTRLYELTSNNGVTVRILDTPGLADTRGCQEDELHKESIATQILNHIDSVIAVLILTNGTMSRVAIGTDYALSTLSDLFPKSLASNTAFMFTNVSSPLHWNFSEDTVPDVLREAPQFLLNNPIALQKKYLRLRYKPYMQMGKASFCKEVKASEENAINTLADLFDWLDDLEPMTVEDAKAIIADTHPPMDQAVAKGAEHPADMNQEPPSDHTLSQSDTDNATLVRRKGEFVMRIVEACKEGWRRRWGS